MEAASAVEAGLVAVPERLLDLRPGRPEVLGLTAEVVDWPASISSRTRLRRNTRCG
jgi:hypothetical protein